MYKRLFALAITACASAFAGATYTVTDLGILNPYTTTSAGISTNGYVTGANAGFKAFVSTGGQLQGIATSAINSWGQSVNSLGQAVGFMIGFTNGPHDAFLYSGGTTLDLGLFGGYGSEAYGINDSSLIAGTRYRSPGGADAFLLQEGPTPLQNPTLIDIGASPTFSGYSYAFGLNNAGQATGEGMINGIDQAYIYSAGVVTGLGTVRNTSRGQAISSNGLVAGYNSDTSGNRHAFLANILPNSMQDLGTLSGGTNSWANGVNASGSVVGKSEIKIGPPGFQSTYQHPFLYFNGVMTDLTDAVSGWVITDAAAINDAGQIAASAANGHAILLTPTASSAVPEPASIGLFALGSLSLFLFSRKRSL